MADEGFTLTAQDLQPRRLHLVSPLFQSGNKPMSKSNIAPTRDIANRRIVVEIAFGHMHNFDVFNMTLPITDTQAHVVSDMVKVIAVLTNMQTTIH